MLLIVGALAGASPVAGKSPQFIGFSADDGRCAWRVSMRRPRPAGGVDAFTLIRLVDLHTEQLVASYRDGAIGRFDANNRRLPASSAQLLLDNPDWAAAQSQTAWLATSRRERFTSVKLEFKDNLVRLGPDHDSPFTVAAHDKTLIVQGQPRQALGFTPVARLFEGETMALGHFRADRRGAATWHAALEIFHSKDGHGIALVNRFDDGAGGIISEARVFATPPDDPIASTKIGVMPMVLAQDRSITQSFGRRHPEVLQLKGVDVSKFF